MPSKTQAIKSFLAENTLPDLAALYDYAMECQVNVAQDSGERVQGDYRGKRWYGYEDANGNRWKSFRIPFNAATEPEFEDKEMTFDLSAHAEGIGLTGWDWEGRCSKWCAFDFDAIVGHSDKHTSKLSFQELDRIKEAATKIPWVTVRKSTGGQGLHLYVFLDNVPTQNHTEHSALGRAILTKMSGLAGFDFTSKVDICGGNMWVWHRKMEQAPNALQLIKQGCTLTEIPENWRAHLDVVSGKNKKVNHNFGKGLSIEEKFEQTAGQRARIKLDADHLKLINWLNDHSDRSWWWDADHHMLITHTLDLKLAHAELGLKGLFETTSSGSTEQNCFAFPMRRGAWSVRRYSLGAKEDVSWTQDGRNWTQCYYNHSPDLKMAAQAKGANEHPQGGFVFKTGLDAEEAALSFGGDISIPNALRARQTRMIPHKDGKRIIVKIPREAHDPSDKLTDWLEEGKFWIKIITGRVVSESDVDNEDLDDVVRHVVAETGGDAGWLVHSDGLWRHEPLVHVRAAIQAMGYSSKEVTTIIGSSVTCPWKLTVRPFQPEYLGDRCWNQNAPQYSFPPAQNDDLTFPHWQMILDHIGNGLDNATLDNPWCQQHGITSGAEWLRYWIACMFQYPLDPLPYLFIYSEMQNTGKSILHEALSLLFHPGYQRADKALTNPSGFNGELEGAVLCVIEETSLSASVTAYNRIKDWVTSPILSVRPLHIQTYDIVNTTHWIQTANERTACPVFPGDTRIVVINVPNPPKNQIPKGKFMDMLRKEASHFLGSVLRLEVPEADDRLRLPCISSQAKMDATRIHQSPIDAFIEEKCFEAPGHTITLADFYEKFIAFIDPQERLRWGTKQKVTGAMPDRFPKGRDPATAKWCWGNISFEEPVEQRPRLITHKDFLRFEG